MHIKERNRTDVLIRKAKPPFNFKSDNGGAIEKLMLANRRDQEEL